MDINKEDPQIEKKAKAIVFALMFANFFRNLGLSIIEIGLPDFVLSLSGSLTSYGIIIGVFSITQAIFQFPISAASDKVGRKLLVIIGTIVYIIGTFLCYFSQNIIQLILFRAIQGAGAYSSILQAMVGDHYRKQHGKGMAFFSFSMTLGFFGGVIIGGYISNYLGFRMIFLISTLLGIFSLLMIIFFVKEKKKYQDNLNHNENGEIIVERIKKLELKVLVKDKYFNIIVILNALRWGLFSGVYIYFIWLLQIHFELNQLETTFLLTILTIVFICSVISGGYLSDRYGAKKILLYSQTLLILMGLFIFFSTDLLMFIIAGFFIGIGFGMFQTSGYAILSKHIDENHHELKGSAFGFNNTLGFIFGAFGPILICSLGEVSTFLPYYLVSFVVIFTLLITIRFIKEQKISTLPIKNI
ncbi:MAG: MFS transporter [Promethearchaeota archaeon]|nr:MAG: MFS transporter [Candidatus Lokiarchaeota archaeon]